MTAVVEWLRADLQAHLDRRDLERELERVIER